MNNSVLWVRCQICQFIEKSIWDANCIACIRDKREPHICMKFARIDKKQWMSEGIKRLETHTQSQTNIRRRGEKERTAQPPQRLCWPTQNFIRPRLSSKFSVSWHYNLSINFFVCFICCSTIPHSIIVYHSIYEIMYVYED